MPLSKTHLFSLLLVAKPSGFIVGTRNRWIPSTNRVARGSRPFSLHSHSANIGSSILAHQGFANVRELNKDTDSSGMS
jgi:hypothetical protein